MPIQTHVKLTFSSQTIVGLGPQFNMISQRPGGVAQGADGPLAQYAGKGETHRIDGVSLWIPITGLPFSPWKHTEPGQEFDAEFNEGEPALGGRSITFHECLFDGAVSMQADNEQGLIKITGSIRAVRRSGD